MRGANQTCHPERSEGSVVPRTDEKQILVSLKMTTGTTAFPNASILKNA